MRVGPVSDLSTARRSGDGSYVGAPETTLGVPAGTAGPPPLYWRMLRLHFVRPNGWQRAVLVEGVTALAVTLVLADVASAWTLLALPVAVAVIVKAHDVLAGFLPGRVPPMPLPPATPADYLPVVVLAVAAVLLWLF
jgi:hypothetical protein